MNVELIVEAVKAAFWIVAGGCIVATLCWPMPRDIPGGHRRVGGAR